MGKFLTKDTFFLLSVILLAAVMCGLMLNPYMSIINPDSAIFCLLAKSLVEGKGYVLSSMPNPQPYFTFPPLLSLQLATLMKFFPQQDLQQMVGIFKTYIHILFLFSLPLFYFLVRDIKGRSMAMVMTLLLALNPLVYKYSADILSDVPYWAFSIAALVCAWKWQQSKFTKTSFWVGCVLLTVFSALTRQIGIALALSLLFFMAKEKQWKPLLISGLIFAFTIGGWQSYEHFYRQSHTMDTDFLNQAGVNEVLGKSPVKLEFVKHFLVENPVSQDESKIQSGPQHILQNVLRRIERYGEITVDQILPPLSLRLAGKKQNVFHLFPFVFSVLFLFMMGYKDLVRKFPLLGVYLLLYLGVLSVYPYVSPRFLIPVIPFILLSLGMALEMVALQMKSSPQWVPQRVGTMILPLFLLITLVGGHLPETIRRVETGYKLAHREKAPAKQPENKSFYKALVWLKYHTPEDSLVVSRKPPVTYFYANRKSIGFPFTAKTDAMMDYFRDKQSKYTKVFTSIYFVEDAAFGESQKYLKPVFEKYRDRFALIYREPLGGTKVWRLKGI